MKLTINFLDDVKAQRDIDEICVFYGYDGVEKKTFVEQKLKEYVKEFSRKRRLERARENLSIED